MSIPLVTCTKCTAPLPGEIFNLPGLAPCPGCGQSLQVEVFPALFQGFAPGQTGEAIMEESESSCFYHPQKKAVLPCDACGRFLCALCDCELDGQHICPSCLETGKRKGKIKSLQNHRVLYDSAALALAVLPAVTFFGACLTVFTSPVALYLVIRHWKTPGSIVHRTKIRFILALIFASLTLLGWFFYAYLIFYLTPRHRRLH
jgi:hypothetical protein